jgi:hypothetical protein
MFTNFGPLAKLILNESNGFGSVTFGPPAAKSPKSPKAQAPAVAPAPVPYCTQEKPDSQVICYYPPGTQPGVQPKAAAPAKGFNPAAAFGQIQNDIASNVAYGIADNIAKKGGKSARPRQQAPKSAKAPKQPKQAKGKQPTQWPAQPPVGYPPNYPYPPPTTWTPPSQAVALPPQQVAAPPPAAAPPAWTAPQQAAPVAWAAPQPAPPAATPSVSRPGQ